MRPATTAAVLAAVLAAAPAALADCQADADPEKSGGIRHVYVYESSGPGHREGDVVLTKDGETIVVNGLGLDEQRRVPDKGETWQHFATERLYRDKFAPRMVRMCIEHGRVIPPAAVKPRVWSPHDGEGR
jgi:hypothetical protein